MVDFGGEGLMIDTPSFQIPPSLPQLTSHHPVGLPKFTPSHVYTPLVDLFLILTPPFTPSPLCATSQFTSLLKFTTPPKLKYCKTIELSSEKNGFKSIIMGFYFKNTQLYWIILAKTIDLLAKNNGSADAY